MGSNRSGRRALSSFAKSWKWPKGDGEKLAVEEIDSDGVDCRVIIPLSEADETRPVRLLWRQQRYSALNSVWRPDGSTYIDGDRWERCAPVLPVTACGFVTPEVVFETRAAGGMEDERAWFWDWYCENTGNVARRPDMSGESVTEAPSSLSEGKVELVAERLPERCAWYRSRSRNRQGVFDNRHASHFDDVGDWWHLIFFVRLHNAKIFVVNSRCRHRIARREHVVLRSRTCRDGDDCVPSIACSDKSGSLLLSRASSLRVF